MAILSDDQYSAFVSYLRAHPEAVDELRPLFLSREVLALPVQVARLVEESARLREEFHAFRTEITERTESLRQEFIDSRTETQRLFGQLTKRIDDLALQIQRHESRHGNYEGPLLEVRYARNLGNWLRLWIRSPKTVVIDYLERLARSVGDGELTEDDIEDVSRADFIIRGRRPPPAEGDLLAVVEVSFTIDQGDVERAARRAGILGRAGYDVVAVVGGYEVTADASERASLLGVGIDLRQLAA